MTSSGDAQRSTRQSLLVAFAAVAVALVVALPQLGRPLVFDEIEFPLVAQGVLHHGVPLSLPGEDPFVRRNALEGMGYPGHYGLWHPPLYVYMLAGAYKVAGVSVGVARGFGIFCGLVALGILWMWGRDIERRHAPASPIAMWAVVLCALNPYFLQALLAIDIDNTLLMPVLLLFLWRWESASDNNRSIALPKLAVLCVLFALCLATKLTTPALVGGALGLMYIARRDWSRVLELLGVGVGGVALFIIAWLAYVQVAHVPADFFLKFTFLNKTKYFLHGDSGVSRLNTSLRFILWSVPGFALLTAWAMLRSVQLRDRARVAVQVLSMAAFSVAIAYTIWVPMIHGKYKAIVIPVAAILIATVFRAEMSTLRWISEPWRLVGWTLACAMFAWFVVGDLFLVPSTVDRMMTGSLIQRALHDPRLAQWLLAPLPIIIGPWVATGRSVPSPTRWFAAFVGAYLGFAVAQNVRSVTTNYSPLSFMVRPGFSSAADFLRESCGAGLALTAKEMGYAATNRCKTIPIDEMEMFPIKDDEDLRAVILANSNIEWVVESRSFPYFKDFPKSWGAVENNFETAVRFGDYTVFRRKR